MSYSQLLTLVLFAFCLLSPCCASPVSRGEDPEEIVKSESDDNEYRAVTLSNKIRCVLVSDRTTEMAAVEIRIAAGYLGEDTPGLAHFVEHMVFEGSVEHPVGNYYQTFVKESGGTYNGATWESATTYMFSISNESWVKAARLLASFIGNPLFPREKFPSAMQAVDSEYKISIRNDYRSIYAIAMKLSNPKNRYGEFSVGSKETLNITDIYEQTLQFHDRFYSANLVSIAVVANDTLDRLETLAEEVFGKMPNRNRKRPQNTALPFPTEDRRYLGKKIFYEMKTSQDQIALMFPINMAGHVNVDYITYLLDHEGRGSIYQYLLSRGYATGFGSFIILEDSQTVPLVVYCRLTEKGIADPHFVVETVFKYLKAACSEGVDVELWRSINLLSELHFRFQEKAEAHELATSILDKMGTTNDSSLYLGAPSQLVLDVEVENKILSFLNPDNFNIYIGSDTFSSSHPTDHGPQLTKSEYFYSTPYLDTNITEELLELWRNVETDPELHLPRPNTFVPTNFELFEVEEGDEGLHPVEIVSREEGDVSVWWLQDQYWRQPRLYTGCMLYPARTSRTPRSWAIESMLYQIYSQVKDLYLYEAWEADFNTDFTQGDGWEIKVHGYSDTDKIESVLKEMLDVLFSLDYSIEEGLFNATVVRPVEELYDEEREDSYSFAYKYIDSVVYSEFVDPSDVKRVVGTITQGEIQEYMLNYISDLSLVCGTFGNARREDAIKYANIIKKKLVEQGSTIQNEDRRRMLDEGILKLPAGPSHVIRRRMVDSEEVASTALVMFQIGKAEESVGDVPYTLYAFSKLLSIIIDQTCFNYLRTEKQLGYLAFCYVRDYEGVLNFFFGIQGSRPDAGPHVMSREVNNLIKQQHEMFKLLSLTSEGFSRFELVKQALSDKLTMKPRTLMDQSSKHLDNIFSSDRDFYQVDKKLAAVSAMTMDRFLKLYETYFVGNEKRKITAQVYGKSHEIPDVLEEGEVLIPDVKEFRRKLTETY